MRRVASTAVLVGRCSLLCEGLSRILGAAGFRVVASAGSMRDLGPEPARRQPLLLVLDSSEVDVDETIDEIALFRDKYPAGRVAVIADKRRVDIMLRVFQAGANVYLSRSTAPDAFIKALELVMLGETILPPELLSVAHQTAQTADELPVLSTSEVGPRVAAAGEGCARLSSREDCILRCLVEGASNKVIARRMDIAEATVKAHIKAILRKIRVHNRTQAAIWAINNRPFVAPDNTENVLRLPLRRAAGRRRYQSD